MSEMSHPRKHHREAVLVRGLDDFLIAHGAAGLDYRRDSRCSGSIDAVAEREEGIRSDN